MTAAYLVLLAAAIAAFTAMTVHTRRHGLPAQTGRRILHGLVFPLLIGVGFAWAVIHLLGDLAATLVLLGLSFAFMAVTWPGMRRDRRRAEEQLAEIEAMLERHKP